MGKAACVLLGLLLAAVPVTAQTEHFYSPGTIWNEASWPSSTPRLGPSMWRCTASPTGTSRKSWPRLPGRASASGCTATANSSLRKRSGKPVQRREPSEPGRVQQQGSEAAGASPAGAGPPRGRHSHVCWNCADEDAGESRQLHCEETAAARGRLRSAFRVGSPVVAAHGACGGGLGHRWSLGRQTREAWNPNGRRPGCAGAGGCTRADDGDGRPHGVMNCAGSPACPWN